MAQFFRISESRGNSVHKLHRLWTTQNRTEVQRLRSLVLTASEHPQSMSGIGDGSSMKAFRVADQVLGRTSFLPARPQFGTAMWTESYFKAQALFKFFYWNL